MNVLVDYLGHSDLHYSFYSLFEKRLGWQLFTPEGLEWKKRGFIDLTFSIPSLNVIDNPYIDCERVEVDGGVYKYHRKMELDAGRYIQKAITFDSFLKMDFDVILTGYAGHEKRFYNLVKKHKPRAVFIRQIGNIHELPLGYCMNILLAQRHRIAANHIIYYPEHYEGYSYTDPPNHNTIKNFADDFLIYKDDLRAWNIWESTLKEFMFKMYGRGGRDRFVGHLLMPQAMKDSAFIWHVKAHGGGGFVVRQALACGRPCIIKKDYAVTHHEIATPLFVDSLNCIDLDLGVQRGIERLKEWSQPDRHIEVCKATAEHFNKNVNFAAEAERIREWIENRLPR